jgi:hypothetical protein
MERVIISPSTDVSSDLQLDPTPAMHENDLLLRTYCAKDQLKTLYLHQHGLLPGVPNLPDSDPLRDLDHIEECYLRRPQDHFWVAVVGGDVRRLRVYPAWQLWRSGAIVIALIEKATPHARQHDCLKLALHELENDKGAITILHQEGFEYARAREQDGRHSLEFYLNLYVRPERSVPGHMGLS